MTEWYSDHGSPNQTLGNDGDYYVDIDSKNLYQKSSAWNLIGNVARPQTTGIKGMNESVLYGRGAPT